MISKLLIPQKPMYNFLVMLFISLITFNSTVLSQRRSTPLIIDHTCIDLNKIPSQWIEKAKNDFRLHYGHTSHGKQIIPTGVERISTSLFKVSRGENYLPHTSDVRGNGIC